MATSYYQCSGTVSNNVFGGLNCSTGWQTYTPPTNTPQTVQLSGELLTASDTTALLGAIILLVALWATFKIILNTMGIKL